MPPLDSSTDPNPARPPATAPFDAWAVLDFWRKRWYWLAAWTLALAVIGAVAAHAVWGSIYTSTAELLHYPPPGTDDSYRPRDISTPSLVLMLQSPALLDRIGASLHPRLSAKELADRLEITADQNNDVVMVDASAKTLPGSVELANRFCAAALAFTRQLQRDEASAAAGYVNSQLAQVNRALAEAEALPAAKGPGLAAALAALPEPTAQSAPIDPELPQEIQQARERLAELLMTYTPAHPLVIEQQAKLDYLEGVARQQANEASAAPTAGVQPAVPAVETDPATAGIATPDEVALAERLRALVQSRAVLVGRQRALEPFRTNPPGYFRVFVPAAPDRTYQHRHRLEMILCAGLGAFLGFIGSAGQILLGEFLDNRIKTRSDVRRVTGLPLIATLGDLNRYTQQDRALWAFRTWTALQSHLSLSPNHGMVCGITSAHHGEGRSTWVELLARAAGSCGFRVLTVTARPQGEAEAAKPIPPPPAATARPNDVALSVSVLSAPAQITEQLASPDGPPRVNIPLPGWVWNLERRKQWRSALEAWRAIDHIVIFVELPPASEPEAVLLGENIPNLIWLVESGKADSTETHVELATLRDARCNLVGAVLNRESAAPVRGRFTRWLGSSAFALLLGLALASPGARAQTAGALTTGGGLQRAAWQQRLTLGPGDVLTFRLFGAPELTRQNVAIGPDGRVSFLEARGVLAAGLTVDELRERIDEALSRYRRSPQAMVTPVSYRSKRYYVLGNVVQKGSFVLDRPVTVLEAVARARGFAAPAGGGGPAEPTDFSRAFLERDGQRVPIDFARLFLHGDLSQNVTLQPGDYLYFPAATAAGDIFVLGAVRLPGPVTFNGDDTVLSAVADRGGFLPAAWSRRVLVVRESEEHPQAYAIDLTKSLEGRGPNFRLQPGDIVYVANRPWYEAEELLENAATAFVEAATFTWTDVHVGPKSTGVIPTITP